RDSAGELLPFSPLGGWLIGARAAILGGIGGDAAFATTLVDVTAELIAQVAFTAIGVGLLALRLGSGSTHTGLIAAVFGGLALSGIGAATFIAVQRRGSGLIEALARRWSPGVAMRAEVIGRALATIYERPWRVAVGVSLHFTAWVASAVGCWLALRLAGVDVSLTAVIAIESLVTAARSAVVVAPMGLGVQEAAYAVVGPLFGLGSDLAIALSLLKRARDLTIGLPALLAWQALEGRRLLANRIGTAGPRPE
ncbi:MAG: lysylphosphatidylglycerol synthase domain-containing protein, partial [Caulobacteraceae bacterium]